VPLSGEREKRERERGREGNQYTAKKHPPLSTLEPLPGLRQERQREGERHRDVLHRQKQREAKREQRLSFLSLCFASAYLPLSLSLLRTSGQRSVRCP